MTYVKPANLTFTQICQWIDQYGFSKDCDEEKLCQYFYHLSYFRTQQFSYFKDAEKIDDFCLFCVSKLFQRYRVEKEASPVKSVSNYLKNVISCWRAEYIKLFCVGSDEGEIADFDPVDYSDYLIDIASERDFSSYATSCTNISDIVRKYLKKVPRARKSREWSNIYVSCLLTLNDRLSTAGSLVSSEFIQKNPQKMDRLVRATRLRPPVLYHLDECYSNYITTLVNELTHAIAAEVSYTIHSKVSVGACMRNLIAAANNDEDD